MGPDPDWGTGGSAETVDFGGRRPARAEFAGARRDGPVAFRLLSYRSMSNDSGTRAASFPNQLNLDDLDHVAGGAERAYGWSASLSYGIGTVGVTRLDNGNWYFTGGGGIGIPSLRVGASVDRVSVTANDGSTIDDALTGWSTGGSGHVGIGGSVFSNDSGKSCRLESASMLALGERIRRPRPRQARATTSLAPLGSPSGDYFGFEPSPYVPLGGARRGARGGARGGTPQDLAPREDAPLEPPAEVAPEPPVVNDYAPTEPTPRSCRPSPRSCRRSREVSGAPRLGHQ